MISVAELAGTHSEAIGPGFSTKELGQSDAVTKLPKGNGTALISSHHLEALRLLLIWFLHFIDLCTDVGVAVLLFDEGRTTLFAFSVVFLVLPILLRWILTSFTMNPCTPDFLGLREENPPLYPKLAYIPIFGELVVVINVIAFRRKYRDRSEPSKLQDAQDVSGALVILRLLEGAFEAMPQTVIQGIVLYEDLTKGHVRFIQWQSFVVSFLALGTGFASVAMRQHKDKMDKQKDSNTKRRSQQMETSWQLIKGFCLMLFMAIDSFLRMNSIATVLYSPYAIWFPLYIATAYAGLPFLVVTVLLIHTTCCEKKPDDGSYITCCGHLAILGIMYCGTLLVLSLAFLIPLDLVMCWTYPPVSLLRLLEHLAMAIFGFWVQAPLTWVPLALWFASAIAMIPARRMIDLPCGEDLCKTWCSKMFGTKGFRKPESQVHPEMSFEDQDPSESSSWKAKVRELSYRGFSIEHFLDFCKALRCGTVMPHFDATKTTTNDVVRQVIIPWSRLDGPWSTLSQGHGTKRPEGRAMAICMEHYPRQPMIMVTHNWDNLFAHLAASTFASALGFFTFDHVLMLLADGNGINELRNRCTEAGCLQTTVWICAFSINQHASICGGFGPEPVGDPEAFAVFDRKRRDTVTGKIYRTCTCESKKYFNDDRDQCELNKFDAVMYHLHKHLPHFRQAVAVDVSLQLFQRAWCVAELVEARRLRLKQQLVVYSRSIISMEKTSTLKKIRVQDCQASRKEDVDEILAKIDDKEKFNQELQGALFEDKDSLFSQLFQSQLARSDLQSAILDALP